MLQKKIKISLLLLLGLTIAIHAQESVLVSGGNAAGSGGSVSYSVGLIVYNTNTGTNGSVAQGVQQPFEISVVSGLEESAGIYIVCTVYPNPATDFLILNVANFEQKNVSYKLYDINGKLLESKQVQCCETNISMSQLANEIYFLKIYDKSVEVKSFKIVKSL